MATETETETTQEIAVTAPPEGFVSTKELVAAVLAAAKEAQWCGAERSYLNDVGVFFERERWDPDKECYTDAWIIRKDSPEFISKKVIKPILKQGTVNHDEFEDAIRELGKTLGITWIDYEDTWTITINLSTKDLQAESWNVNVHGPADSFGFRRAVKDAATQAFYTREGLDFSENNDKVSVVYNPDPRREDEQSEGTNAAE